MQLTFNTPRDVAKATAADLQCCAHSATVPFVIQTQIMECMYVKDCSSTIVLQLSRPELHHREQLRNRRPEDQRKNRRAAGEQQQSNSRTAVKKQRDSSSFHFVSGIFHTFLNATTTEKYIGYKKSNKDISGAIFSKVIS